MSEINLTQAEAEKLIEAEKHRVDDKVWDYPNRGEKNSIPLISPVRKEQFLLDMYRGSINLKKVTYQERVRKSVVLLRLDLGTAPHRNPDGEEIPPFHLHRYREGFGDKWALPLPGDYFKDLNDLYQVLKDFMEFCNIVQPPVIRRELFS